jgi:hypothetical protein
MERRIAASAFATLTWPLAGVASEFVPELFARVVIERCGETG